MKAALGPLVVDEQACAITRGGLRLGVSRKGVELIARLGRAGNRPVERQALLRDLWPDREVSDKALSMLVVEVRRQLSGSFPGVEIIRTLPGLGYALSVAYELERGSSAATWEPGKSYGRMSVAIEAPQLLSAGGKARELAACLRDTLLNALAGERGLELQSREISVTEAAAESISLIVQSSVRIIGRDVLLSARCVSGGDGRICWGTTERAPLSRAFDAEMRLCGRLRRELGADATGHCGRQMWRHYRQSAGFAALADGQRFAALRNRHGLSAARERFRHALALDPGCAPALVGMADCEILSAFYEGVERTSAARRALVYVDRALALDSQLSSAHGTRGFINLAQLQFVSAERELLEAIRLDDSSAIALQWYADFLASQGRMHEAVQAGYLAVARAPDSALVNGQLGQMLHMAGLYDEAKAQLERVLQLEPECAGAHCFLALNHAVTGDPVALELSRRSVELAPDTPFYRGVYGGILAQFGERERALQQLHTLEASASRSQSFGEAAMMVATALGQARRAIDLFRSSTANGATWALYAAVFPILNPIHAEPSFKTLVRGRGMALTAS